MTTPEEFARAVRSMDNVMLGVLVERQGPDHISIMVLADENYGTVPSQLRILADDIEKRIAEMPSTGGLPAALKKIIDEVLCERHGVSKN